MHARCKTRGAVLITNPRAGVVDDEVVVNPVAVLPSWVVFSEVQPDAIALLVVHKVTDGFELGCALDGAPDETQEVQILGVGEKLRVEHASLHVGNARAVVVMDAQVARSESSIGGPNGYGGAAPRNGLAVDVLARGSGQIEPHYLNVTPVGP